VIGSTPMLCLFTVTIVLSEYQNFTILLIPQIYKFLGILKLQVTQ